MLTFLNQEKTDVNPSKLGDNASDRQPAIAFLHCMDLIDDFLDHIKISLENYCNEFVGSWVFGYVNALQKAGVRPVLFCISARVTQTTRFTHRPTGARICVIPASKSYLAYRGIRRSILSLYGAAEGQTFQDIQDTDVLRRSPLTSLKDSVKSIGTYLSTPFSSLARELKREGCQAILCQEYEYARFDICVLLGHLIGVPVFATFQGGDATQSWLEYLPRQLAFKGCQGVVISTQKEIERVQARYSIPSRKIARIFDPMDTATWYPIDRNTARTTLGIPAEARVVVCHGRIDFHRKGLDILMAAWEQICRDRPNVDLRLLLVGTGPDAPKLRQHIADRQLQGIMWRDEFVNDRTVLRSYLSAADVYTLTSRQEGFPIAPLEAMACGLPVVATDAPGVPDILEAGEQSGGIVIPREDAQALVIALGRILDDLAWAQQLGQRARDRIEQHFSPEAIGQQLSSFFLGT